MDEESYLGEIRLFAGDYAPQGWLLCDGSTVRVDQYEALATLLGTTWGGSGDTFALPDLRGRVPIGMGQLTYGSDRRLGEAAGAETVAVNIPPHTHVFSASSKTADQSSPKDALLGAVTPSGATTGLYLKVPGEDAPHGDQEITVVEGKGLAHENSMPSTALTYIICVSGIFPDRD